MVSYAVFRATTSDPIPAKSSRLYVPQVDSFGPTINWNGIEPSPVLSYMDAIALWQARKASRQTLLYPATWQMESDNRLIPAVPLSAVLTFAEEVAAQYLTFILLRSKSDERRRKTGYHRIDQRAGDLA